MKRIALASIIAATFCSAAVAQSIITLIPEQRERIRTYVETHKEQVDDVFVREKATVGSTLPNDVPLSKPAKLFRDWIVAEAKGSRRSTATHMEAEPAAGKRRRRAAS